MLLNKSLLLYWGSSFFQMETSPKTLITLNVSFNIDIEYDPFVGRTLNDLIDLLQDDLFDAAEELRPEVKEVYNMSVALIP